MKLTIREATTDDLPQVLALYAQPGLDDGRVLDIEQARAIHAQFARYPSYRLFVACDSQAPDRVLGSYALLVMHNLAHLGTPSAIAEDVVVDARCRSQGIGREMMDHAVGQARAAGCYKLALSSNRRRVRAHAFYESLGFARHGVSFVIDTSSS
ncbi:MAG: GNAT family N-acetyltransferase [Hydrogenophaga sp.]|nr:GNAT family N-acetyltransferase [Hydrogenophaga sp.]